MCATIKQKQKTNKRKYSTTGPGAKKERNTVLCIIKVIHDAISQLVKQQAETAKCEIRDIWIDHFFKLLNRKSWTRTLHVAKRGTKLKHTKR